MSPIPNPAMSELARASNTSVTYMGIGGCVCSATKRVVVMSIISLREPTTSVRTAAEEVCFAAATDSFQIWFCSFSERASSSAALARSAPRFL